MTNDSISMEWLDCMHGGQELQLPVCQGIISSDEPNPQPQSTSLRLARSELMHSAISPSI